MQSLVESGTGQNQWFAFAWRSSTTDAHVFGMYRGLGSNGDDGRGTMLFVQLQGTGSNHMRHCDDVVASVPSSCLLHCDGYNLGLPLHVNNWLILLLRITSRVCCYCS
jgi:hypothetical protein